MPERAKTATITATSMSSGAQAPAYCTVLHHFLMPAALGYPLTFHETCAFACIRDAARCINLAFTNSLAPGDKVQIIDHMTETHCVCNINKVSIGRRDARIDCLKYPLNGADENDLLRSTTVSCAWVLCPASAGLMEEMTEISGKYVCCYNRSRVPCLSLWRAGRETFPAGTPMAKAV